MEFWVVDEAGSLCDGSDLIDAHGNVEPEFVGPLVEVKTDPHDSEAALREDLQGTLRAVIGAAEDRGKRLVPLGTPLTTADFPAKDGRGELFERIYGAGVESAKNCAGTHMHFERENARRQLDVLTALDPALALVSTSPYYCGERMMASSRAYAYRTKCGKRFRRYCALWDYADDLEEWEERVEDLYGTFLDIAAEKGVDPDRVEEHFAPEDTVLNPVRLRHEQPTVEWRAPDTALPSQILRLTRDVGELVAATDRKPVEVGSVGVGADRIGVPKFDRLRTLSQLAIRSGLGAQPVRLYLQRLGLDPTAYQPISPDLRGPPTVSEADARTLRLKYAELLRQDVRTLDDEPDRPSVDRDEQPATSSMG